MLMQEVDCSWPQTATEEDVLLKDLATRLLSSLKRLAAETESGEGNPPAWPALVAGMRALHSCGTRQQARDKVTQCHNALPKQPFFSRA